MRLCEHAQAGHTISGHSVIFVVTRIYPMRGTVISGPRVSSDGLAIRQTAITKNRVSSGLQNLCRPSRMSIVPGALPWLSAPSTTSSFATLYEKTSLGGPLPPVSTGTICFTDVPLSICIAALV